MPKLPCPIVTPAVIYTHIDELKQKTFEYYASGKAKIMISDEDIEWAYECMTMELLGILKNRIGDAQKVTRLQGNSGKGFDGTFVGMDDRCLNINTVLAGGWNIQKLHFRTLVHIW